MQIAGGKKGATSMTYLFAILFIISAVVAGYYYRQYSRVVADPTVVAKDELDGMLKQMSTLMVLPTGETPTFLTVNDLKPLEGQQFFANAKVGDKLIIYSGVRKAILYRPSEKKIIEVAPINYNQDQAAAAANNPALAPTEPKATTTKK